MLVLLLFTSAQAQEPSVWKSLSRFDFGMGIHAYSIATDDSVPAQDLNSRANLLHLGIMAGLNLPFVPIGEHMSLGFNPNIGFAVGLSGGFSNEGSQSMSLELPLYATMKFGTDATWLGAKFPVGATVGVGYHYSAFIFATTGVIVDYGLPSVMAELNFGKRRGDIGLVKIRYSLSLGSHTEHFNTDSPDDKLVFTHHSFYVLVTPGY
jgi:hypothetical protein